MLFSWKIDTFIFELGIEADQHTQFFQIYKPSQGISTPRSDAKKREVIHLSYDAPAIASRLRITTIRANIPPKTKSFCLSVAPFWFIHFAKSDRLKNNIRITAVKNILPYLLKLNIAIHTEYP